MNWVGGARYRLQQQERQNNRPIHRFFPNRGDHGGGGGRGGGAGGAGGGGYGWNYHRNNSNFRSGGPPQQQPDLRRNNNAASRNYIQRLENKRTCPLLAFAKESLPTFGQALALQLSHELELDKAPKGVRLRGGARQIQSDESLSVSSESIHGMYQENDRLLERMQLEDIEEVQPVSSLSPYSVSSLASSLPRSSRSRLESYRSSSPHEHDIQSELSSSSLAWTPTPRPKSRSSSLQQQSCGHSRCVGGSPAVSISSFHSCPAPSVPVSYGRNQAGSYFAFAQTPEPSPATIRSPESVQSVYSVLEGCLQQIVVASTPGQRPRYGSEVDQTSLSYQKSVLYQADKDPESIIITPSRSSISVLDRDRDLDDDDNQSLSEILLGYSPGRTNDEANDIDINIDVGVVGVAPEVIDLTNSPVTTGMENGNRVKPSSTNTNANQQREEGNSQTVIPLSPTGNVAPSSYFESRPTPEQQQRHHHETLRHNFSTPRAPHPHKKKMVQKSLYSYFQSAEAEAEADANAKSVEELLGPDVWVSISAAPAAGNGTPNAVARVGVLQHLHLPIFSLCGSEASMASATSLSQILPVAPVASLHGEGEDDEIKAQAQPFSEEFMNAKTGLREIRIRTPAWLATPFSRTGTGTSFGSLTPMSTASTLSRVDNLSLPPPSSGTAENSELASASLLLDLRDCQSLLWSGRECEPPEVLSSPGEDVNIGQDGNIIDMEDFGQVDVARSRVPSPMSVPITGGEEVLKLSPPPPGSALPHIFERNEASHCYSRPCDVYYDCDRLGTGANVEEPEPSFTEAAAVAAADQNRKQSHSQHQGEPQYRFGLSSKTFEGNPVFIDVNVSSNLRLEDLDPYNDNGNPFQNFTSDVRALSQGLAAYFPPESPASDRNRHESPAPQRIWSLSQPQPPPQALNFGVDVDVRPFMASPVQFASQSQILTAQTQYHFPQLPHSLDLERAYPVDTHSNSSQGRGNEEQSMNTKFE